MKAKFFQLLEEMNKADPRFTVYAKALLFYYIPNQGELFITHNWYIADLLGIHENTLLKAKKELVTRGVIFVDPAYSGKENNRRSGTYVTVNYDWKASNNPHLNKLIQNKVIQNKVIENKVIENKLIQKGALIREKDLHRENDLPRENDLQGKDLTREKAEGAAEPPFTAPDNITAPGQQNNIPEAIEQTDLFGDPVPLQEKPRGKQKQKFIPPTKEEVRTELISILEKHSTIQHWTENDLQTKAAKFFNWYNERDWKKNNGQKLKDWKASLNTQWLSKQNYLPEKASTKRPGQARGQITTAASIMDLAMDKDPQQVLDQRRAQEIQKGGVYITE
ncbi:hypothetical protein [Succinimonas amylolytica]|uniref:hypothetical protein n=1 Tax=Succinimonas amylolytica TaxID=83769 RepID=UPI0023A7F395